MSVKLAAWRPDLEFLRAVDAQRNASAIHTFDDHSSRTVEGLKP
jgi:hypothetical protein